MFIANLRVTHETAPHDVLSRMMQTEEERDALYRTLLTQENIDEVVIIQTCNRFEVFFSGKGKERGTVQAREVILSTLGADTARYLTESLWVDAISHLFRLVSSIESLIVGENQILTQVKEDFCHSSEHNYSGRVLRPIFQKALSVGKRVRTETRISNGKVSVSSAAVDLANEKVRLEGRKVILVGSGKMAALLATYLRTIPIGELVVIGRTPARLEAFCGQYLGRPLCFDHLVEELRDADVLFSATSCPHVLITLDVVERAMEARDKPLIVVDIAMPKDVDPSITGIPRVNLYCLDDLREISERNRARRQEEAARAEGIIAEEIEQFMGSLQQFHLQNLMSHLNLYAEEVRRQELSKAESMLGTMDHRTEMVMEGLSRSLMKKFMHNFMTALREYPGDSDELKRFVHIFIEENRQPGDGGGRQPVVGTPNPLPHGASHPMGVDMEPKGVEQDVPECTHEKA